MTYAWLNISARARRTHLGHTFRTSVLHKEVRRLAGISSKAPIANTAQWSALLPIWIKEFLLGETFFRRGACHSMSKPTTGGAPRPLTAASTFSSVRAKRISPPKRKSVSPGAVDIIKIMVPGVKRQRTTYPPASLLHHVNSYITRGKDFNWHAMPSRDKERGAIHQTTFYRVKAVHRMTSANLTQRYTSSE